MSVDKISVFDDPRVERRSANLNGKNYGTYAVVMIIARR